jgi:glutamyl-tRNA synthetase
MILGPDKARLSKRHGATSVSAYREEGYLADALVNYLVRLGWSHGDQEVFGRKELGTPSERLIELVTPFLVKAGTIGEEQGLDEEWLARAIDTLRERAKTLEELASSLRYYIAEDVEYAEKARAKFLTEKSLPYLADLREAVSCLTEFTHEALEAAFQSITEKHGIKLRHLAQPVRVAMTGGTESPGIFDVLEVVGREKTLARLERAIGTIQGPPGRGFSQKEEG